MGGHLAHFVRNCQLVDRPLGPLVPLDPLGPLGSLVHLKALIYGYMALG